MIKNELNLPQLQNELSGFPIDLIIYYSQDGKVSINFKCKRVLDSEEFEEITKIIKNHKANEDYKQARFETYPGLSQQLDDLWHDIDSGKLDKTGLFYTSLKGIKDTYPKVE